MSDKLEILLYIYVWYWYYLCFLFIEPEDDEEFKAYLSEFLISENGQHFLNDIKFSGIPAGNYQILVWFSVL